MKFKVDCLSKQGSGRINEDAALIKDNLFAVFDGAGSLVSFVDERGRTGGYLASTIAKGAFSANDVPLRELRRTMQTAHPTSTAR